MIMGYYRLGKYDDARRSMKRILEFRPPLPHGQQPDEFRQRACTSPSRRSTACTTRWGVPAR